MLNYFDSENFAFGLLFILFILVNIAGIIISVSSTSIEGYINRNRHLYQNYINSYKAKLEEVTDPLELFFFFDKNIASWFKEFKSVKYLFFTDDLATGDKNFFYDDPLSFNIDINDKKYALELYFISNSVEIPREIATVASKYKGNILLPIVYHNELNGFVIIESKKVSHSANVCVHTILDATLNCFERLSLFTSIIEAEKKIEMLKHFQETGKMVSIIAHELRSPLTSIMFNMEVIKDSFARQKEPDAEYLDISLKEIRRLNDTVEKMLNYGRTIKLSPVEGSFKSLLNDISHIFTPVTGNFKIIETVGEETFCFDWDMLKNVLTNMLNNSFQAIEASGKRGSVTVKCFKRKNRVLIEIADTGPGIPEEIASSIFEPFFTTKKEGNGLGLATSEKIVKLSGGQIVLKETSKKGTTFQITLPI
ncbi:MAG: sensor histidine kinase [bacterium]